LTREVTAELERDPVYIVRTPAFDGPIELLLTLAQRAEVDLKAISLAGLTDDYLRAIEQDHPPLDRLAAFLVIGARLVQLKAAGLMPDAAVGEEDDLQAWEDAIKGRLEEYKRFKELAESLMRRHASGRFTFAGLLEPDVIPQARVQVSLDALASAFRQVLQAAGGAHGVGQRRDGARPVPAVAEPVPARAVPGIPRSDGARIHDGHRAAFWARSGRAGAGSRRHGGGAISLDR